MKASIGIGGVIRTRRKSLAISMSKLGRMSGVCKSVIFKMENTPNANIELATASKLALALQWKLSELILAYEATL